MDFYYPNPTNDFWYMTGLIFAGDRMALTDPATRRFDPERIKALLRERHIALGDTAHRVSPRRGKAAHKYIEIFEP